MIWQRHVAGRCSAKEVQKGHPQVPQGSTRKLTQLLLPLVNNSRWPSKHPSVALTVMDNGQHQSYVNLITWHREGRLSKKSKITSALSPSKWRKPPKYFNTIWSSMSRIQIIWVRVSVESTVSKMRYSTSRRKFFRRLKLAGSNLTTK